MNKLRYASDNPLFTDPTLTFHIRIWNTETTSLINILKGHCDISPNSKKIISGSFDGSEDMGCGNKRFN